MRLLNYKKIENFVPYGFILIGLILSVFTLTIQPLWFDEHLTMNEAQSGSLKDMMTLVMRHESIPPLFYLLEYCMVKLFSLSDFSLRIIPALAGILGCFFYWRIFFKVTDRSTAVMSLVLCVSSSFLIVFSQEARPHSMLFCESMILLFFSIRWLEKHDIINAAGIAVSMFIAVNTHYYALFLIAAVIVSMFIVEKKRNLSKKGFIVFITSALISVISVSPWLLKQLALQVNGQKTSLISKAGIAIPYIPISTLSGAALEKITVLKDFTGLNSIVLLLLLLVFIFTTTELLKFFKQADIRQRLNTIPFFLILFFAIAYGQHILTGFRIPSLHPRYTIYFMMFLFGGILSFTASRKIVRNIVFVILLIINVYGHFKYWGTVETYYRVPWKKIVADIDAQSPSVSVVASTDHMHIFVLPFYMKSNKRIMLFDSGVFGSSKAPLLKRDPYRFYNRDVEIYQRTFEYYNSDQNKPDTSELTFMDFVASNPQGLYIYQEDGRPYNEDFLKNDISDLKMIIISHYNTNQGIVYIIKWEYVV